MRPVFILSAQASQEGYLQFFAPAMAFRQSQVYAAICRYGCARLVYPCCGLRAVSPSAPDAAAVQSQWTRQEPPAWPRPQVLHRVFLHHCAPQLGRSTPFFVAQELGFAPQVQRTNPPLFQLQMSQPLPLEMRAQRARCCVSTAGLWRGCGVLPWVLPFVFLCSSHLREFRYSSARRSPSAVNLAHNR